MSNLGQTLLIPAKGGATEPIIDPYNAGITWAAVWDGADLGSDGAAIAQWDDHTGNTRHATQATAGKRPVVSTSGLNGEKWASFTAASTHALTTPTITPPSTNKATMYVVMKNNAATAIIFEGSANAFSNNGTLFADIESSTFTAGGRSTTSEQTSHGLAVGSGWRVYAVRFDRSLRKMRDMPSVDGAFRFNTLNASNTATTNFAAYAGFIGARNQTSLYLNGGIAWMGIAFEAHSPQLMRDMVRSFSYRYGLGLTATRGFLAFDGDSNVDANDVTQTNKPWPAYIFDSLTGKYDGINFGVGGQGFGTTGISGTMAFDAATQIDPLINADTPGKNVLFASAAVNDLYTPTSGATAWNSTTKENTLQRIKDYCTARKAAGWKVVLLTVLPNNNPGWDATAQSDFVATERPYINNWIKNNAVADGYADAIVDLTVNTFLEDETNATYYHTDKAHLLTAGHSLVSGYCVTALATLGIT